MKLAVEGIDCLNGSEINSSNRFKWGADGNGNLYYGYDYNHKTDIHASLDNKYIYHMADKNQYINDEAGNNIVSSDESLYGYSTFTIKLFRCISDGSFINSAHGIMRIYWCDIVTADKKMHLIPVRIENTGYLYDTINNELFGNAGTGEFSLGQDI